MPKVHTWLVKNCRSGWFHDLQVITWRREWRGIGFRGLVGQNKQEEALLPAQEVGSADRKWHVGRTIQE